ncbi:carbon-nitrogen hydrolase family protein [Tunturibacter empetritectus]|uniref:Carbon-nitrogen hydrolase family protein n=1 Tax=Tunturiibacter empetritectus TaxID=3069691 RepID=A0AAU7ZDX5_9BACT
MNEKTIATIALRDHCFADLQAVLREAAHWVEAASLQGADLAVLPETINLLHQSARDAPLEHSALDDWRSETAMLREGAAKHRISLVLPLLVRDGTTLANRFYLLSRDGAEVGFYQKQVPATGERLAGVQPASNTPLRWEGLTLGGGICIDVYFPHSVFDPQMEAGADLFVIPSMTPAGAFLDSCAVLYGVPFVLAYSPWSRILDRDGKELAAGGLRSETLRAGFGTPLQQACINFNAVSLFADFNGEKIQALQRHYGPKVRVRFEQSNCLFFVESRSVDLSIGEIMREFGLVSRRDYFAQLDPEVTTRSSAKNTL